MEAMQSLREQWRKTGRSVGFVPTMGALHKGHGALIATAAEHHAEVVVSVFVNPTQFGPHEDFERYPRNLDRDVQIIREYGGTAVFAPSVGEMYPAGILATIHAGPLGEPLEGRHRPGHFDGVATVVHRLLDIVRPDVAYFGAKDFQQTLVIKAMVEREQLPTGITVLPTVREPDGLAMSSRNAYLTAEQRTKATVLWRALVAAQAAITAGKRQALDIEQAMLSVLSTVQELDVDYAVAVNAADLSSVAEFTTGQSVACLIAARLGTTRLIDNAVTVVP